MGCWAEGLALGMGQDEGPRDGGLSVHPHVRGLALYADGMGPAECRGRELGQLGLGWGDALTRNGWRDGARTGDRGTRRRDGTKERHTRNGLLGIMCWEPSHRTKHPLYHALRTHMAYEGAGLTGLGTFTWHGLGGAMKGPRVVRVGLCVVTGLGRLGSRGLQGATGIVCWGLLVVVMSGVVLSGVVMGVLVMGVVGLSVLGLVCVVGLVLVMVIVLMGIVVMCIWVMGIWVMGIGGLVVGIGGLVARYGPRDLPGMA